jgi:hypothetical protein
MLQGQGEDVHPAATRKPPPRAAEAHGIEVARIILGHSTAFTTEIYAEADKAKAADVMAKMG